MVIELENHDSEFSLLPVWLWHQSLTPNISPIITSHKKCVVWHFNGIAIPLLDSPFHKYHFCSTILLQKSVKKHKRYSFNMKKANCCRDSMNKKPMLWHLLLISMPGVTDSLCDLHNGSSFNYRSKGLIWNFTSNMSRNRKVLSCFDRFGSWCSMGNRFTKFWTEQPIAPVKGLRFIFKDSLWHVKGPAFLKSYFTLCKKWL